MAANHVDRKLAAATGSYGGLGKVAALASAETVYVRCDCDPHAYKYVDWLVSTTAKVDLGFYAARSIADSVTLTLSSFTDADTIVLNGLTITGESTAADAAFASRKFSTAGGTDTLDAAELVKVINADNTITPNGSVSVGDTITVVTTCNCKYPSACPGHTYTFTAAAAADYPESVFDQSGNQAAELASIVLAINHKRNVTLASCTAGNTVSVTIPGDQTYTFTAHATTTTAASRQFSIAGTDSQDGDELVTCMNDATYGLGSNYTAVNAAGVVSITVNSPSAPQPVLSSSSATLAAVCNTEGGVPGVVAAATGATGELALTPTWVKTIAVTTSNGTRLPTADIDIPGIYATSADAVVTLTPGTPGSPAGGQKASVIQATAAARCTVSQAATLLGLRLVSAAGTSGLVADLAANNTTAGTMYTVPLNGYERAYLSVYADGTTPTIVITATPRN